MEISVDDAMLLLASLSERAAALDHAAAAVRFDRDVLIALFDGQQGMGRTAMAEACGMTRARLFQIVSRHRPGAIDGDGVEVSDALRAAMEDVLADAPPLVERVALDVVA